MRVSLVSLIVLLGLHAGFSSEASAQTCTGLCLQQVSCPNGGTTSVSGVVYAPNGIDPLPNVLVYVPNAPVDDFVPGVSCPVVGAPPSGSPLVGATTAVDGTFTLPNMPVGANIPLVVQSGRWRRQVVIPNVAACVNTPNSVNMPRNSGEGDIPKIAIATGSVDSVECVLRKVGLDDTEFTNPSGTGRVNFYLSDGSPGSGISATTPSASTLMGNSNTLNSYDVLMLPCEGSSYTQMKTAAEYANLVTFANLGGRVYSSHFSYQWLYQNPPFDTVAKWAVGQNSPFPDPNFATVNTGFSGGQQLSQWLQLVGASTKPGQIQVSTLRHDTKGVNPPTEVWLTLNDLADGNPVMQMVFDTPVGITGNQCGRVLFDEYHVEGGSSSPNIYFPRECAPSSTPMNAQEKLLEYSLFELTNDGGAAKLSPTSKDFGTVAVGFNSPAQNFSWTNNSTFGASVSLLTGSGDFSVVSNNCASVAPGASCIITMVFSPTALGPRTGTLTVGSSGTTLTADLTGIGIPALTISSPPLDFGSHDVGSSATQSITATNANSGPVPVPAFVTTGDYATNNNCGSMVAAGKSCTINVIFTPTTTGVRAGTVGSQTAAAGPPIPLSGNGIDFTMATSPTSGKVIAGYSASTVVTTTPLAGFASNLTLGCTTNAPGSKCMLSSSSYASSTAVAVNVTITTTSQYTVIGYGGAAGGWGWLSLAGLGSGLLLWMRRRSLGALARSGLTLGVVALALGAASLGLSGCSGLVPAQNANYTMPGTYTYTISATDGFLVHNTTYSLDVTAK